MRIKDVEFVRREIIIREGKGSKDRVTVLPENLMSPLREQIRAAGRLHLADVAAGQANVHLPHALARKYPTPRKAGAGSTCSPART